MSVGPLPRLLGYVRPHWMLLGAAIAGAAFASTLDGLSFALLIPFLRTLFGGATPTAPTGVERIVEGLLRWTFGDAASLRHVAFLLLATVAVKNAAGYGAAYAGARLQEGLARDLRAALFGHLQKLGLGFFRRTRGGQLLARMLADPDQAKTLVSGALVTACQNGAVVLVYLAIMFSLAWRLTVVILVLAPAITLVLRPILRAVRERARAQLHERGEVAVVMTDALEGARVVKAHGAERSERRRFEERLDAYYRETVGAQRLAHLAHPVSETLGAAVIVVLLAAVSATAAGAAVRPELFLAFLGVTLRLLPPVKALSQFPAQAATALSAAERVFEILDVAPDDLDPPTARPFPGFRRELRFDHVWFAYELDAWVLRGVSLRVQRGEVVALVGPSGAGKSTLVDLLPRFVDPDRGAVLVDGVPTTVYSRRSLRSALGIVSQQTVIFNDTVRANIAYGDQAEAALDAVRAAARAANAEAFIERLPQGYETVLGEHGARLSGGERQRIAIARAILRDPPVLILDEATSALDAESDRLVQEAIQRLMEGRTVLVIAHRLSTVARADRIAVLDGGVIAEEGRHADLMVAGGLYQRLHAHELVGPHAILSP